MDYDAYSSDVGHASLHNCMSEFLKNKSLSIHPPLNTFY